MYLVQSDGVKVLKDAVELSSSTFKSALGTDKVIYFSDDQFKPLIDFLKVIDEEYAIVIDMPNVAMSSVIAYESDPSRVITYEEYTQRVFKSQSAIDTIRSGTDESKTSTSDESEI